ncbi:MAG: hypothetical protein HFE63_09015 [Clostridiales bacterium]|nr:hypothetical protein [Clostridiales bacterium]
MTTIWLRNTGYARNTSPKKERKEAFAAAKAMVIEMQRQLSGPDNNKYYENVAKHFRRAKYFTIILLIAFLLTSITFNRSEITIENLQYLMKFISFTNTETSITATKINYSSSDNTRLSLFIGDLCYLSPNGYALYDSRGNTIMTDSVKYTYPILKTSAKFALCLDLGGNSYSIFNTFARLHSETLDYPITGGDIADSGAFVIATSTREYRTAVQLYDSDFNLISRILRESYLADVKYKSDGSEVAIMTFTSRDGSFVSTLDLVKPGSDSVRKSAKISGLAYSLYYTGSGVTVITDSGLLFYNADLDLVRAVSFPSSLVMADCSDKYLTCVYASGILGNSYRVVVYDMTGRATCEIELDGKLAAVSHDESGDYIFILANNRVTRLNLVNRRIGEMLVESGGFDILPLDSNSFLLAMNNYALTCETSSWAERYIDRDAVENGNNSVESGNAVDSNNAGSAEQ